MLNIINQFFQAIKDKPIELYSEFGLQHDLAIFIKCNYPNVTVRLEYPTAKIFDPLPSFIKKEIDIYITTEDNLRYVLELKLPKDNGGIPKAMYNAIEDVKFLEQLRKENIDGCYSILASSCKAFWNSPRHTTGIYNYFKGEQVKIQSIRLSQLPTFLHKKGEIQLESVYETTWNSFEDTTKTLWKYYVLEI